MFIMRKKTGIPNPTDKHVGSRVRMRRVMLNLTQTELARRLGFSYQQLQKYETGINRLAASRLQQVSHILQCQWPSSSKAHRAFHDRAPGEKREPCQTP